MPRYKIIVEYLGTNLCGWQYQPHVKTVQGLIEAALQSITQKQVRVIGAGRTDSGVHAMGQVAHFDLANPILNIDNFMRGLNHFLHIDNILIKDCALVPNDFHARASALSRSYKYVISEVPSVFDTNKVLFVRNKLDIVYLQKSLSLLLGTHDFSSFAASACQSPSPITTLLKADVERDNHYVTIYFTAQFFLHHMIRNIVGSVLEYFNNNMHEEALYRLLLVKDRQQAGPTISPNGLYLTNVQY